MTLILGWQHGTKYVCSHMIIILVLATMCQIWLRSHDYNSGLRNNVPNLAVATWLILVLQQCTKSGPGDMAMILVLVTMYQICPWYHSYDSGPGNNVAKLVLATWFRFWS